ncbi:neutral zinc metallopeptidase [Kocuria sp. JC486]|uniref:KPN_02809 family neutral zinc metallopeptidase n=1 Tax=Kocuria sp. JC486 TaxID=1970736 RepID=UPI00141EA44E|nr:neutral zinc metallopeptidase [Kocuria sp. JC486]NHU84018.1 neutral zinc metallopeptidase [Kocuria sp. JC486]
MSFEGGGRLDTSRVQTGGSGGGGGRGMVVGGGLGGLLLTIVLGLIFGQPVLGGLDGALNQSTYDEYSTGSGNDAAAQNELAEKCQTSEDANSQTDCRVVATANSLDAMWSTYLPESAGVQYNMPGLVLFSGSEYSPCGTASSATGPFYCPSNQTVYLDSSFYSTLQSDFGAEGGPLAEEYVLAHEFGHHIQYQLGYLGAASQDQQGEDSGAVRVELQADCYAGVWANRASSDDFTGGVNLEKLTEDDLRYALSTAEAIGDDHIQQTTSGRVNPEAFTHGTSDQRVAWFMAGYNDGDIAKCDTFSAGNLDDPASIRG